MRRKEKADDTMSILSHLQKNIPTKPSKAEEDEDMELEVEDEDEEELPLTKKKKPELVF